MRLDVKSNPLKLAVIVALVLLAGAWWKSHHTASTQAGGNAANQATQTAKASLTVSATQARPVHWPMTMTLNGTVYPWQEAMVSAEIGGLRITQVLADVGMQVKKGQPLALLAAETVQADLQKQLATVEKDKAALAEAQSNAARAREIKESGAISAQKINEYLIAEQTAKANLALSQAELENQQIRLRQTKVIAPDDGVISSRTASLGNVVNAGAELFRLVRQSRIEWRGEVNANQQIALHAGQTVHLGLPNGKQVQGRVRLISPTVDNNTRNALVYVDVPKDSAKPGMYLQGKIEVGQQVGLAVPLSAVIYRDGFAYVFVIHASQNQSQAQGLAQVSQRKVRIGRSQGGLIELLDGVEANARLVLTGGAFLNEGDSVNIAQAASATKGRE